VDDVELDRGPVTKLATRLFDERVERVCYGEGGRDGGTASTGGSDGRRDDGDGNGAEGEPPGGN
jgi:hypothetical protein